MLQRDLEIDHGIDNLKRFSIMLIIVEIAALLWTPVPNGQGPISLVL